MANLIPSGQRLSRHFFTRPSLIVAPELLGKYLVRKTSQGIMAGKITEVEVYLGQTDPASHAFKGKTHRNSVMWQVGGYWYVYQIYGLHFCLNIVTEVVNQPAAILIRAIEPVTGIEQMKANRSFDQGKEIKNLSNGPGKVSQALKINLDLSGVDSTTSAGLWLEDWGESQPNFKQTTRIGLKIGRESLWRFLIR